MPSDYAIVKLDLSNAINSLNTDVMLTACNKKVPEIFRFCYLFYDSSTTLIVNVNNHTISSHKGVQLDDSLGQLLFSLSIHPLLLLSKSNFKLAYMNDIIPWEDHLQQ